MREVHHPLLLCNLGYAILCCDLERGNTLPDSTTIKELLEAGAHFGHQTSYWHPKMKTYIFTKRDGIHIINLEQTAAMLEKAFEFVKEIVASGGTILFVGTKKQAHDAIEEEAKRCAMCWVNQRWVGGTLTNFGTIQARIDHLVRLEDSHSKGEFSRLPKKEAMGIEEEITKLNKQMGGIKSMTYLPSALFVVDTVKESIAIAEAKRMGIPVVAMVDTNSNPDDIDMPIPANDDAIRAVKLICHKIADAVLAGKAIMAPAKSEEGEGVSPAEGVAEDKPSEPEILTPDDNK
ncbi:MAG: 30S ribosomal protein S2 [Dehalococcoidales bacterium]|nr:30S ribosomal protein S2 [Dehalococcoidales bacterium]